MLTPVISRPYRYTYDNECSRLYQGTISLYPNSLITGDFWEFGSANQESWLYGIKHTNRESDHYLLCLLSKSVIMPSHIWVRTPARLFTLAPHLEEDMLPEHQVFTDTLRKFHKILALKNQEIRSPSLDTSLLDRSLGSLITGLEMDYQILKKTNSSFYHQPRFEMTGMFSHDSKSQ